MSKILTLALVLGFTAACETTKTYELSPVEVVNIEHCGKGVAVACIEASLDAMRARHFRAADRFAEEACVLGHPQGCGLAQDLLRHPARNRGQQVVNNDGLVNLLNESSRQMGTVGGRAAGDPPASRTRCVSTWNSFLKQQETLCEGE